MGGGPSGLATCAACSLATFPTTACCWDEATGAVTVFRSPSSYSNGNTRTGRDGSSPASTRPAAPRTEHDGRITVLADSYDGKRLNAPNDVVIAHDGAIWFTDPGYGILFDYEGGKAKFELPTNVYRIDPQSGSRPWSSTTSNAPTASASRPTNPASTS